MEEEETQKSEGMAPSVKNWTHHGGEGGGGVGGAGHQEGQTLGGAQWPSAELASRAQNPGSRGGRRCSTPRAVSSAFLTFFTLN